MPLPTLSQVDPATESEGSLDPLGLSLIAEHLADTILPGMTARMWRPRFLTAIAVASSLTEKFQDRIGADGTTPPYLTFEWYMLLALARSEGSEGSDGLHRVPGIDKARRALKLGVPMSARMYLKTPSVFGFHGVYKVLAKDLMIVDRDLRLQEIGYELVRIWEKEQVLISFGISDGNHDVALRNQLERVIAAALDNGCTVDNRKWSFFPDYLHPKKRGNKEARFIWNQLSREDGTTRKEVFQLSANDDVTKAILHSNTDRDVLKIVRREASSFLRNKLDAIEAFERLACTLENGFWWIRHLSTQTRRGVVNASDFKRVATSLSGKVAGLLHQAATKFEAVEDQKAGDLQNDLNRLADSFRNSNDLTGFFEDILNRHLSVQKNKPPSGKRPWFDRLDNGGVVVRPAYRLWEPPPRQLDYVHGYRIASVNSFIKDLRPKHYAS